MFCLKEAVFPIPIRPKLLTVKKLMKADGELRPIVFNSKTAGQRNKTQTTTEALREPWINDHVGDHSIPRGCRSHHERYSGREPTDPVTFLAFE